MDITILDKTRQQAPNQLPQESEKTKLDLLLQELSKDPRILDDKEMRRLLSEQAKDPVMRLYIDKRLGRLANKVWETLQEMEWRDNEPPRESYTEVLERAKQEQTPRVVDQLLPRRGLSLVSADPKCGKSTLGRNVLAAILKGDTVLDRQCTQGPCLYYIAEEDYAEAVLHLEQLGVENGLAIRIGRLAISRVLDIIRDDIQETNAVFCLIDPIGSVLGIDDINAYAVVQTALYSVVEIARQNQCHIMGLTHESKAGNSFKGMVGSVAFRGGTDCNIVLDRRDNNDGMRFIQTEKRYHTDENIPRTELQYDETTGQVSLGYPAKVDVVFRAQYKILKAIGQNEEINRGDLQNRVKVGKTVLPKAIDQLVECGRLLEKSGAHSAKLVSHNPDYSGENLWGV